MTPKNMTWWQRLRRDQFWSGLTLSLERTSEQRRAAGRAYASGELTHGATLEHLEAQAENGTAFDGRNPFDEGILDVVRAQTSRATA